MWLPIIFEEKRPMLRFLLASNQSGAVWPSKYVQKTLQLFEICHCIAKGIDIPANWENET